MPFPNVILFMQMHKPNATSDSPVNDQLYFNRNNNDIIQFFKFDCRIKYIFFHRFLMFLYQTAVRGPLVYFFSFESLVTVKWGITVSTHLLFKSKHRYEGFSAEAFMLATMPLNLRVLLIVVS